MIRQSTTIPFIRVKQGVNGIPKDTMLEIYRPTGLGFGICPGQDYIGRFPETLIRTKHEVFAFAVSCPAGQLALLVWAYGTVCADARRDFLSIQRLGLRPDANRR